MTLEALIISFRRGTPSVTFILATPAKWKVFRVICVPEERERREDQDGIGDVGKTKWFGE